MSLSLPTQQSGFDISVGQSHRTPILKLGMESGQMKSILIHIPEHRPSDLITISDEERGLADLDVQQASGGFEKTRVPFREAIRALVGSVFSCLPSPGFGVDVGSGATGEMWRHLIPPELRSRFLQLEISPAAVEENRRRNADLNPLMVQGSYLHFLQVPGLTRESVAMITGLSTLDATHFPEAAVSQMKEVLQPGGYILHFQDVRPGFNIILDELVRMRLDGRMKDGNVNVVLGKDHARDKGRLDPFGYILPHEGPVSVVELFRRRMQRVFQNTPGIELLMNDWVVAKKQNPPGDILNRIYYENGKYEMFEVPDALISDLKGIPSDKIQEAIQKLSPEKKKHLPTTYCEASGVITLARKKA